MRVRTGLHQVPWSQTIEVGLISWADFMVQFAWSHFLINQFTKPLGLSLGVNQMWTKKNDHAPKSECYDLFNICPKRAFLKKNSSLIILLSFLGFTCIHFLLNVSKMWLKNLLTIIFLLKKNERFDLYVFNTIYMSHVACVTHWALFATRFTMLWAQERAHMSN